MSSPRSVGANDERLAPLSICVMPRSAGKNLQIGIDFEKSVRRALLVGRRRRGLQLRLFQPPPQPGGRSAQIVRHAARSLARQLGDLLATPSRCDPTRDLQGQDWPCPRSTSRISRPSRPGRGNQQRLLHPAVVQRKVPNGYRATWAAEGEAGIRTVVDTARLASDTAFGTILKSIGA